MPSNGPCPAPPSGFTAFGLACGIKESGREDLAVFVSDRPCAAAGVFTMNRVVGAPVRVTRKRVPSAEVRAVILNSGNSNDCTGEQGVRDGEWMTERTAAELGLGSSEQVLLCSTGIIGHLLPRPAIDGGISDVVPKAGPSASDLEAAARAMMTTDTYPKWAEAAAGTTRVVGLAKGAAMIAPWMGTMLSVVMTDAKLSPEQCDRILRDAINETFNCITIDGDMSPSDTVLLLANGASNESPDETEIAQAVRDVCESLSRQIVDDGEGTEHVVTIDVRGLKTRDDARTIANSVANSLLVKTAITGNDPNWGRIVCAAGYAGVEFIEPDCSLKINGFSVYEAGLPIEYDEEAVSTAMATGEVHIELDFTLGDGAIRIWTTDLTAEYVRLNSEYTT